MRKTVTFIIAAILMFYCSSQEITKNEKQQLLNEQAFAEYGFTFPDVPGSKYTKYKLPDGAIEIRYTYKGYTIDSNYFYLSNTITTDRYLSNAKETYISKEGSIQLSKVMNSELVVLEGFQYGDESVLYVWYRNGEPAGNYFQFRQKNITYQLLLQGFYFPDTESWKHFFNSGIASTLKNIPK